MIIYGLSTCDSTRKAMRALDRAEKAYTFRDVRAQPLSDSEIEEIVREFGEKAVNRQSTTFRSFNAFLRESDPEAQIAAQPTVMKRPVIHDGKSWYLGWSPETEAALTA